MSAACAEELRALVRAGWRLVALETFEEDRALALLERAAAGAGAACLRWTLASGLGEDGRGAGSLDAGLAAIAAHRDPALFALLDAHRVLEDPKGVRRLRDLLPELGARRQAIVLVAPVLDLPLELVRDAARLELPLPGPAELRSLFARLCDKQSPPQPELLDAAVRGALGLGSGEAARVFRKARAASGALDASAVAEIVRDKRRALRRTPALAFHDCEERLGDVGGLGELKRWLAERRRAFGEEARRFGLPAPRGLLLLGIQGCGKSLCAKAVASEWQFPLLRLDVAAAFGSALRSPEAAMREASQVAESIAPAVLWIDEIEKGFAAAEADVRSSRVLGAFLTWLAEKRSPVFVVATANDVTRLPPELLRRGRFDELFFVDLPTQRERVEILAIHLRKHARDPKLFRLDELGAAAERMTGAELEQAVVAGLHAAFAASRELTSDDVANALTQTVPLYETYEERIKELRDWARTRARPASTDSRMADLFG
jgi:SpoVK/Ycf46/Vps4 family AAA+-type ATPase